MNYLTFPFKFLRITQSYTGSYSHSGNLNGSPKDYPIDVSNSNDTYFYCPCDEIQVMRIWGVGGSGTNTIWLQSTSPVITPKFTDYVTIMCMHPNDNTLSWIKEGQKFKRGDKLFAEGHDGNVTGDHIHMSVSRGKYIPAGWIQNNQKAWVITGNSQKPEDAFFIDRNFTTVLETKGIDFQYKPQIELPKPVERNENIIQIEVIVEQLRARTTPEIKDNNIIGFVEKGFYNFFQIETDEKYDWYEVEENKWIADNGNYIKYYPKKEQEQNIEIPLPEEPKKEEQDIDNVKTETSYEQKPVDKSIIVKIVDFIIKIIKKLFHK